MIQRMILVLVFLSVYFVKIFYLQYWFTHFVTSLLIYNKYSHWSLDVICIYLSSVLQFCKMTSRAGHKYVTARERKYQPKNGNINRRTEISTEERKYQPKNGNINRRTEISTFGCVGLKIIVSRLQ